MLFAFYEPIPKVILALVLALNLFVVLTFEFGEFQFKILGDEVEISTRFGFWKGTEVVFPIEGLTTEFKPFNSGVRILASDNRTFDVRWDLPIGPFPSISQRHDNQI